MYQGESHSACRRPGTRASGTGTFATPHAEISTAIQRLAYAPRYSVADGLDETMDGYAAWGGYWV